MIKIEWVLGMDGVCQLEGDTLRIDYEKWMDLDKDQKKFVLEHEKMHRELGDKFAMPRQSVFVLVVGWYHEGYNVIGTYSTLEAAKAAATAYIAEHGSRGDYMDVDEYRMDGPATKGEQKLSSVSIY
jgi:hypothetical protein